MLPSSTNSARATSGIEIFTLPIPVQTNTERTDSAPNTAMTISRDTRRRTIPSGAGLSRAAFELTEICFMPF